MCLVISSVLSALAVKKENDGRSCRWNPDEIYSGDALRYDIFRVSRPQRAGAAAWTAKFLREKRMKREFFDPVWRVDFGAADRDAARGVCLGEGAGI